jgi:hypothetical protein
VITTCDILALTHAVPHCTEHDCPKCASRARWNRRKGPRSRKNPIRRKFEPRSFASQGKETLT